MDIKNRFVVAKGEGKVGSGMDGEVEEGRRCKANLEEIGQNKKNKEYARERKMTRASSFGTVSED